MACCRLEVNLRDLEIEVGGGGGIAASEDARDEASPEGTATVLITGTLDTADAAGCGACANVGGTDLSCGGTMTGVARGGAGH